MRLQRRSLVMATSQVFPLFPTPVGVYNFGKDYHDINESIVKDILKEQKSDPEGQIRSNMGGWHSNKGLEKRYESFKILKAQIEDCVNDYARNTGHTDGLEVENLWTNINKSGDMNMGHHHALSACTGVYYPIQEIIDNGFKKPNLKYNYNYTDNAVLSPGSWNGVDGGCITFQDPAYGKKIQLPKGENPSPYTLEFFHLYPTAGVLVVMPSHLIHHVTPFREENKTRISISFVCVVR